MVLAGLIACVLGASVVGTVHVAPHVAVEGSAITLGEIATLDRLPEAVRGRVAALALGPAAAPGRERTLAGDELRRRIAEIAPSAVLDLPERIVVHTAHREIAPEFVRERIEQAVRHRMPWPEEAVSFTGWKLPGPFAVASGATRFLVHFAGDEDFLGRVTARVESVDPQDAARARGATSAGRSHARAERAVRLVVEVRVPVVYTKRALRRGELVMSDAIGLETQELSRLPRDVVRDTELVLGSRLSRRVSAGVPLRASFFEAERVVRRGDGLVVTTGDAALSLRLQARALEHGSVGQAIRAENPTTRRRFLVLVTGQGMAHLIVPGEVAAR